MWTGGLMSTVVVSVKPLEQSRTELQEQLRSGKVDPVPRINFVSWELFHRVLAPNRMAIVQAMTSAGPLSIREVARRVGRDFKGVHSDVAALLGSGLLEKTSEGEVIFRHSKIRFEFEMGGTDRSAA
jgi:predicted transcriptional regulator